MNELLFYAIVKAILDSSKTIQGRHFVLQGANIDLNAENFGQIFKDALGANIPGGQKYPASCMLPPVEIVDKWEEQWATYRIDHLFLKQPGQTGAHEFQNLNAQTNVPEHTVLQTWKDMRQVAGDFRMAFSRRIRSGGYLKNITNATNSQDIIRRVSNVGNDLAAGVMLSYNVRIAIPCTLQDYDNVDAIVLPTITDPHPIHAQ